MHFHQKCMRLKFEVIFLILFSYLLYPLSAKILKVEDFGAVADGKTDCTKAFEKAISKANLIGPGVTIQLGKGRYILSTDLPEKTGQGQDTSHLEGKDKEEADLYKQCRKFNVSPCIIMKNEKGITFVGQGLDTEIIITIPLAIAFELTKCNEIIFKDMVIDYDPIPFTQGIITDIDVEAGTFDYKNDDGFPVLSEYWFKECDAKWGMSFDEKHLFRMNGESAVFTDSWDNLGHSKWRMHLHYSEQAKNLKVGDHFVHLARMGGTSALFFSHCGDVKIENVNIYANAAAATIFFRCTGNIHIDGLQVRPRPGSGRIFSLNGDCVHCQSCRKGPLIENCIFEGMSDDGMNFYTLPSVIKEVISQQEVRVIDTQVLQKGDKVQIIRPTEGTIIEDNIEVISIEGDKLTFAKSIDGLKAGKNHIEADTIFNLSACGNDFIVRNNIIGGFRGRGILARAHHGLIESNLIRDTSGQGIVISNGPDWPEGPVPADVTIRNNTLIGVNRDKGQADAGAIQLSSLKLRHKVAEAPGFKDVIIENNRIIDSPGNAILLQGVSNAKLINNLVQLAANDRPIEKYTGIKLESCEDIEIDGFTMTDQWSRIDSAVLLKNNTKEKISIKNIHADLNKQGKLIRNEN